MTNQKMKINNRRDYSKLNFGKSLLGNGGTLVVAKLGCDVVAHFSHSPETISKLGMASISTGVLGLGFLALGAVMTARGYGFNPVARVKAVPTRILRTISSAAQKQSPR